MAKQPVVPAVPVLPAPVDVGAVDAMLKGTSYAFQATGLTFEVAHRFLWVVNYKTKVIQCNTVIDGIGDLEPRIQSITDPERKEATLAQCQAILAS